MTAYPLPDETTIGKLPTIPDGFQTLPHEEMRAATDLVGNLPYEEMRTAADIVGDFPHEEIQATMDSVGNLPYEEMQATADFVSNLPYEEMRVAADIMGDFPYEEMRAATDLTGNLRADLYPTLTTASEILNQYPDFASIVPKMAETSAPTLDKTNPTEPSARPTAEYSEYPAKPSWVSELTSEIVCSVVDYVFIAYESHNDGFELAEDARTQVQLSICCFVMAFLHAGGADLNPPGQIGSFAGILTILRVLFPED